MESSRDDFVDSVQKASVEKIRETYGQQVFSKWQTPRFLGRMSDVSCIGKITGKCGDTIEIYLRKKNDHIQDASFLTDGCACAVACGSVVIELAIGKDIDEVASIGGDTDLEALGGCRKRKATAPFSLLKL